MGNRSDFCKLYVLFLSFSMLQVCNDIIMIYIIAILKLPRTEKTSLFGLQKRKYLCFCCKIPSIMNELFSLRSRRRIRKKFLMYNFCFCRTSIAIKNMDVYHNARWKLNEQHFSINLSALFWRTSTLPGLISTTNGSRRLQCS